MVLQGPCHAVYVQDQPVVGSQPPYVEVLFFSPFDEKVSSRKLSVSAVAISQKVLEV